VEPANQVGHGESRPWNEFHKCLADQGRSRFCTAPSRVKPTGFGWRLAMLIRIWHRLRSAWQHVCAVWEFTRFAGGE
jgi:hypothetical protein